MSYSKGDFANSLGISRKELENKAKDAGFNTTEAYYNSTGGTGTTQADIQAREQGQMDDFMGRYQGAVAGQASMSDVWDRISQETGLQETGQYYSGLRNSASQLQQTAEQMPDQVAGETRGYDVNAGQLQRLQQQRQGEIYKQLTPVAREAGQAGSQYQTLLSQAGAQMSAEQYQQEKELQPYATEASLMNSAMARQLSYYTVDKQQQTSMLLQKLQSENGLAQNELDQLNQLALLEQQFENQKQYLDYSQQFKTTTGDTDDDPDGVL